MDEFLNQVDALLAYVEQNADRLDPQTTQALMQLLGEINDFVNSPIESTMPTGASLLWSISGGDPEVFTNYLKQVPDPALNSLLKNPFQLRQLIQRLQENQPQERNREIDGIPQAPIQSSNIWGFNYDQAKQKLYVKFQGDGIYEYSGVPAQVFQLFQSGAIPAKTEGQNQYGKWWVGKNPSLGASLFELIKQRGYPYERVA